MAIVPEINIDRSLHAISADLDQTEREINRRLMLIGNMDEQLRETWQLAVDVIACQIEAIEQLEQNEELSLEGRASQYEGMLDQRLAQIRDDYLANYKSLLGARDAYMTEDGSKVSLTREKKQELFAVFENRLDAKLTDYRNVFSIDENTDLRKVRESLQEIQAAKEKAYDELFDKKQELTDNCQDFEFLYKGLWSKRKALFREGLKVQDLYLASQVGDVEFIGNCPDLKKKVKQFDAQNYFAPLHYAAYHNQLGAIKELISKGKADPTIKDFWGNQPIHWAAKQGSYRVISYLMTLPSKWEMINAKGEYGRTPLHRSVYNGRILTTELLLKEGADPNIEAEGDGGVTPLHVAIESRNQPMVQVLLRHRHLDVTTKDSQGFSPIHRAVVLELETVTTSLLNHRSAPCLEQKMPELDALISCARKTKQKNILKFFLLRDMDWKIKQRRADLEDKIERELKELDKNLKKQKKSSEERKKALLDEKQKIFQRGEIEIAEYQEELYQSMQNEMDLLVQKPFTHAQGESEKALLSIEEFGWEMLKGGSSSSSTHKIASTSAEHLDPSKGKEEELSSI